MMLVIKVFVESILGEEQIDEIRIQNTGEVEEGVYSYKIRKPKKGQPTFIHERKLGWLPLGAQVLTYLTEKMKRKGK